VDRLYSVQKDRTTRYLFCKYRYDLESLSFTSVDIIYTSIDSGEEIRFSVELTRLRNLPGLLSLDIKRLRGNVWAYKSVHDTIIE
jgi:hypothetical protein